MAIRCLADAPSVFCRPLAEFLVNGPAREERTEVSLRISKQHPCPFSEKNLSEEMVGVSTAHVDDNCITGTYYSVGNFFVAKAVRFDRL